MLNPMELALIKKLGGGNGGAGGGSGADLLNADGIIKQEVLPAGYPYVGKGEVVYVPEQGLTAAGTLIDVIFPAVGQALTITYCGVDYECVVNEGEVEGVPVAYCGNGSIWGFPETSEPFVLIFMAGMGAACAPTTEEIPDDPTIKAVGIGETIIKMEAKFLPTIPTISLLELGSINRIVETEISMELYNALMDAANFGFVRIEYEASNEVAIGGSVHQITQIMMGAVSTESGIKRAMLYGSYPLFGTSFIQTQIVAYVYGGNAYIATDIGQITNTKFE